MQQFADTAAAARLARREAASEKAAEMKASAAQALADFHAERQANCAAARRRNLDEEAQAAAALAREINPWNIVSHHLRPPASAVS